MYVRCTLYTWFACFVTFSQAQRMCAHGPADSNVSGGLVKNHFKIKSMLAVCIYNARVQQSRAYNLYTQCKNLAIKSETCSIEEKVVTLTNDMIKNTRQSELSNVGESTEECTIKDTVYLKQLKFNNTMMHNT